MRSGCVVRTANVVPESCGGTTIVPDLQVCGKIEMDLIEERQVHGLFYFELEVIGRCVVRPCLME